MNSIITQAKEENLIKALAQVKLIISQKWEYKDKETTKLARYMYNNLTYNELKALWIKYEI